MHPRAFQPFRGVSMQPFFAKPDDQGGGAPAPPADPPADPVDPPAGGEADPPPADPVDPPAGGDPPPPEPPKRTDWRQGRMDKLTAQAREAKEAREAAEARAQQAEERAGAYEALYGKPVGDPAPTTTTAPRTNDKGERLYTQAELDALSKANAETDRLNEKLETMFDAGTAAHGDDWKARVGQAGAAFGDQLKTRPDFWQAITKLPNATDVYHALAGDLDHLNEVLAMGPVDLGMELAKLSTAAAAKPKGPAVSKVPAPITPIQEAHESEVDLSKADMQTYAATREAQRQARYDAKYR